MNTSQTVVGIVGSYRKNGVIDALVTEILEGAAQQGAQTKKIYLQDRHIEFCTNCRVCMQQPGLERGKCVLALEIRKGARSLSSSPLVVQRHGWVDC